MIKRYVLGAVLAMALILSGSPIAGALLGDSNAGHAFAKVSSGGGRAASVRIAPLSSKSLGGGSGWTSKPPPSPPHVAVQPSSPPVNTGGAGTMSKPYQSATPNVAGGGGGIKQPPSGGVASAAPEPNRGSWSGKPPPQTAATRQANQQLAAKAYNERSANMQKTRSDPAFQQATGGRRYEMSGINRVRTEYRTTYVTTHHISYVPSYSYGYHPYGFSDFMLNMMIYDAVFAHHHYHDSDYQQWRREADERARSDDQLRTQLAKLDAEVNELQAKGTPRDPKYMPKVPPEVMYPTDALTGEVDPQLKALAEAHEEDQARITALELRLDEKKSGGISWGLVLVLIGGGIIVVVGVKLVNRKQRNPY